MGVQGLLPLLKSIHKPCSLKLFAGQTLGVDAYGWLHRGTAACAVELAQGRPTTKFVDFAMSRVRMLVHFGVRPYLVFDGDYLPSKSGTERDRAARRRESKRVGLEMLAMGRATQAQAELQKAVDVTPEMARQLIEALKLAKIDYLVAPFEADSQLVYLEQKGHIDGIVSEDSDMLVFGAKCLCTKLDQYGECVVIRRDDFTACRDISLVGWSDAEFRTMAILSGCDYLPGIEKMGLKTAYRLLRKHKTVERIIQSVQFEGKMKVPTGYLDAFRQAESTFLYQWVYCPTARTVVNLTEPGSHVDVASMKFIGKELDCATARKVAQGHVHPHTKLPLQVPTIVQRDSRSWQQKPATRAATPTLKQHQSIESFFKPRRTPLAELNPNSFTPSPSQQRLLERPEDTWTAQAAHGSGGVTLATAMQPAIARSQLSRRATSDAWPTMASSTAKRPRLCDDRSLSAALIGQSSSANLTSRFFTSKSDQASPSVRRNARQHKTKGGRSKMEIWSDDSVEDALLDLEQKITSTASSVQIDEPSMSRVGSQSTVTTSNDSQGLSAVGALAIQSFSVTADSEQCALTEASLGPKESQRRGHTPHRHQGSIDAADTEPEHDEAAVIVPCSSPPVPAAKFDMGRFAFGAPRPVQTNVAPLDATKLVATGPRPLPVGQELDMDRFMCKEPLGQGTEDLMVSESECEDEASHLAV